jgi:hypothetical protein
MEADSPRKESALRRFVLILFALCLAIPSQAVASHRPSQHTRGRLNAAVRDSELMPAPIRRGHFRLREARVSGRGPWAKATVVPGGRLKHRLDPVLAIFRGSGRDWRLVSAGTSEVGCDRPRLPGKVRHDLHLICPPGRSALPQARRSPGGSRCSRVSAAGRTARQVRAYNHLGCRAARGHLHHWLRHGFPHDQTGWYCDMSGGRKLCSLGNGAAPFFTFRLRG